MTFSSSSEMRSRPLIPLSRASSSNLTWNRRVLNLASSYKSIIFKGFWSSGFTFSRASKMSNYSGRSVFRFSIYKVTRFSRGASPLDTIIGSREIIEFIRLLVSAI